MNFPARKPTSVSCANGPPYVISERIVGNPEVGQKCSASSSVELGSPATGRLETAISCGPPPSARFELWRPENAVFEPCKRFELLRMHATHPVWVLVHDTFRTCCRAVSQAKALGAKIAVRDEGQGHLLHRSVPMRRMVLLDQ